MKPFQPIIDSFFAELDSYLKDNLYAFTGKDVGKIYTYFWEKIKKYRGNASGFTGLSEFLIFRSLYHLLIERMDFPAEPERLTPDLFKFFTKNRHFSLGQSIPIHIGKNRMYPDVSLFRGEELLRIVQVKVYLTSGVGEIDKEYERFKKMKIDKYPNLKCLLVVFSGVPKAGNIRSRMEEIPKKCIDFKYLILNEHEAPYAEELNSWVDLDTIIT